MANAARSVPPREPVRVLGRGLKARKGVRMTLRMIREGVGVTQVQVSEASGIDQGDVSRLENRTDLDESQLASLRRYVEALGGELDVVARFGNKQIRIVPPE